MNRNIANGERKKDKPTTGILRFNPFKTFIILPKKLNRPPPLTSGAKSIATKIGRGNQTIISQANRCAAIPYF